MTEDEAGKLISGPAYDKPPEKEDPIAEYYRRIDEKQRAIWRLRNEARELGAPPRLMSLLDEWHHRESNTGD